MGHIVEACQISFFFRTHASPFSSEHVPQVFMFSLYFNQTSVLTQDTVKHTEHLYIPK